MLISGKYYNIWDDKKFPLEITGAWQPFTGVFTIPKCPHIYALSGYNKMYIGKDSNGTRALDHRAELKRDVHHNGYMQNTVNKYGISGFYYQPIFVLSTDIVFQMGYVENSYIKHFDTYNNGYNLMEFSDPEQAFLGRKHTEETRKKMSESAKKKIFTEEHKNNMSKALSGEKNPFYGKRHSLETKKKIGKTKIGNKYNIGRIRSQEFKNKISKTRVRRKITLLSPLGEIIEIEGIKPFCDANNLDRRDLYKMIKGKIKSLKGWKLYE